MGDEVGALRKPLSTLHTLVGLFSRVSPLVLNQI